MPYIAMALALLMLAMALSSCTQVEIKNSTWCGSLGAEGAACFDVLDSNSQILTLQQWAAKWDDLSNPMVCTDVSTFTDVKAEIEELCSFENACTYQVQQAVNSVSAKFEAVAKKAKALKK